MTKQTRLTEDVLGCNIDVVGWEQAVRTVLCWATARESRYVCHCNVHSVVTARHDPAFRETLNGADLATPDGMPIAWWLRSRGHAQQPRINGPDLMWRLCAAAEQSGQKVYLYGGSPETLKQLIERLTAAFPSLRIAGSESPPFTESTKTVDAQAVERMNQSGAQLIFIGLGCPKQENWMRLHRSHVRAVMLGVGAAFDYHAGTQPRAPSWMRRAGLEWLHRMMSEPRRLWRRYTVTNLLFLWYWLKESFGRRMRGGRLYDAGR